METNPIADVCLAIVQPLVDGCCWLSDRLEEFGIWFQGYNAGNNGKPRDWSMPDRWHRGFLAGRLEKYKRFWRLAKEHANKSD